MGLKSEQPKGTQVMTVDSLHRIVDDVVIETPDAAFYEIVFAPDATTEDVYIASAVFIEHDTKRLRIVI